MQAKQSKASSQSRGDHDQKEQRQAVNTNLALHRKFSPFACASFVVLWTFRSEFEALRWGFGVASLSLSLSHLLCVWWSDVGWSGPERRADSNEGTNRQHKVRVFLAPSDRHNKPSAPPEIVVVSNYGSGMSNEVLPGKWTTTPPPLTRKGVDRFLWMWRGRSWKWRKNFQHSDRPPRGAIENGLLMPTSWRVMTEEIFGVHVENNNRLPALCGWRTIRFNSRLEPRRIIHIRGK